MRHKARTRIGISVALCTAATLSGGTLAGTARAQGAAPAASAPTTTADPFCSKAFQGDWLLGASDLPTTKPLGPLLKGWERTGKGSPAPDVFLKEWRKKDNTDWNWPGNDGFEKDRKVVKLTKGTKLDRFGLPTGTFLAPTDVSYGGRAIPPSNLRTYPGGAVCNYHVYKVLKPFGVQKGAIAPWFGQPGKGQQIMLDQKADPALPKGVNVKWLLENKYLEEESSTRTARATGLARRADTGSRAVDSDSVRAELRRAGVPDEYYRIGDVHEPEVTATEFYALRERAGVWEVSLTERGRSRVLDTFSSEDEAARRLYRELVEALG
ncbi:TNT domain-containing protein [Streptomyces albireticuli]|uniref:TNT domain-containing protein n=1 Tax=Streptomyces albireticuli TaxID=1940 RepID=UPI00368130C3